MDPRSPSELVVLRGSLADGLGEGQRFTALGWVRQRFRDLLGIDPHPGTVNLRLSDEIQRAALARVRSATGIPIPPEPGFCPARAYRATLAGPDGTTEIPAAIVVPDVPGYPPDQVELVAGIHVRSALGVASGDQLTVRVTL